jgi:hypothetical protein
MPLRQAGGQGPPAVVSKIHKKLKLELVWNDQNEKAPPRKASPFNHACLWFFY